MRNAIARRIFRKAALVVLAVCALFSAHKSYAAPSVSGVSGTLRHGQGVTVSGNGFGTKYPVKPLIWADFENGIDPTSQGLISSWSDKENITTTADPPYRQGSSASTVGIYGANNAWLSDLHIIQPTWVSIYTYLKRRYDFDINDTQQSNQKFWRLWDSGWTRGMLASYAGSTGRCYMENTGDPLDNTWQGSSPSKNMWHTEEMEWRYGQGNGIWRYTRNGTQEQYRNDVNAGSLQNYTRLVLDNFCASPYCPPAGSHVWMDDLYIDNTFARVMICTASSWENKGSCEIQIPQNRWEDTILEVNLNQGSFSDGSSAYLYVVDDDGSANATGFPITFSSSQAASYTISDFLRLVTDWLTSDPASDKNGDGAVNTRDLGIMMSGWE